MSVPPLFPGGTAVSRLVVYTGESVDGLAGGTPHLHTASSEGYVVLSGRGTLQTITGSGFAEVDLEAGTVVWFTPGTIHRAVNHGDLVVLVVMQNAGLPEDGDAVMTFPDEVLADDERYRRSAALPAAPASEADLSAAAHARRDLGVTGFLTLKLAVQAGDFTPLTRLYRRAARLAKPHGPRWRATWESTVGAGTRATDVQLTDLAAGRAPHLLDAVVRGAAANPGPALFGMCGRLHTWDLTAVAEQPLHEKDE